MTAAAESGRRPPFDLRPALVIGAVGQSAAVLWLVSSPVRGLNTARDALRYAPNM